jgi:hypothetical protein
VLVAGPPLAPTAVEATASSTAADVRWNTSSPNGSPILSYTVTAVELPARTCTVRVSDPNASSETCSIVGLLSIDSATSDLALSEVSWFKDVVAKDLVYGDGFGPLELGIIGRKYTTPALNALALGATAGASNARITFAEGSAPNPVTRLNTGLKIEAAKVTAATPNPGKVALSIDKGKVGNFTPGISGSFKGSFELTDSDTSVTPNKNLVRKSEFQGMIVDNGTEVKGYGFFILPKMPTASPKTTLATSPRLSGSVLLEKVNLE